MALMKYESVIGLEVHAQLTTESKMFCSCPADYQGQSINTMVCPVCMGMPGSLPVINEKAVQLVIATGLALNCSILACLDLLVVAMTVGLARMF